jgi:hypothetical protein
VAALRPVEGRSTPKIYSKGALFSNSVIPTTPLSEVAGWVPDGCRPLGYYRSLPPEYIVVHFAEVTRDNAWFAKSSADGTLEIAIPCSAPFTLGVEEEILLRLSMTKEHICVSMKLHERTDFYGRFWQEHMPPHANQATSALYANLAKPLFARFYAELLIPRLGT